ncbi:MAG: LytR C-terminal domain-containing protein [Acidimicrobiales bacterium]
MSTATRGVILVLVAVVLGVLVLGQGFDEPDASFAADSTSQAPADEQAPSSDGNTEEPADENADESGDGSETVDPPATEDPGNGDDATATPTPGGPPDILHTPAEVRVLVANGTTVSGAATKVNNDLIAIGYNGLSPANTNPVGSATETIVYYVDGFVLDARQIAQSLNAPAESVQPIPSELPIDGAGDLEPDVVIILGPDLVTG